MASYDQIQEDKPSRGFLRLFVLMVLAFVCGTVAMAWAATKWEAAAPYLGWLAPQQTETTAKNGAANSSGSAKAPQAAMAQNRDTLAMNPAVLDMRVADLELRITRIAERAAEASGNADRAEGMLVAFAARRAVDRGLPLGYLETLLRDRFGNSQPEAVAAVLTGARQTVTLDSLQSGFEKLSPEIMEPHREDSWWDSVKREVSSLIVIRNGNDLTPRVEERIENIRHSLRVGRVDTAYAEVNRLLAGKDTAKVWTERARQYLVVHNALDRLETAALLDPRTNGKKQAADDALDALEVDNANSPSSVVPSAEGPALTKDSADSKGTAKPVAMNSAAKRTSANL